jgi:enterochelin esterase-like enzyme
MSLRITITMIFSFTILYSFAQLPHVSSGTIKRFENFTSQYVEARNIDVWLPDNYSPSKKYAVLYMQDGQSLFDSILVWTRHEWNVDETMSKLLSEKKIRDCIVWPFGIPARVVIQNTVRKNLLNRYRNSNRILFTLR